MTNKDLTPHRVHVYIKVNDKEDSFGATLSKNLYGKIYRAERTGSHTWQPVKGMNGWYPNAMPIQLDAIYKKEDHPELFNTLDIKKGYFVKIKSDSDFWIEDVNLLGTTQKVSYIRDFGIDVPHSNKYHGSATIDFNLVERILTPAEHKTEHPECYL